MEQFDLSAWRAERLSLREQSKRAPFRRAAIHFRLQMLAGRLPFGEREAALEALGPYVSRGKGRGSVNRVYGNKPGKYTPHQGARECARRVRQMFRFHPGAQTDLMNDRTPRFIAPGVLVAYVDRGIL